MIRGILFDKDGTLLDFDATWLPPYRKAVSFLESEFPGGPTADELMEAGGYDIQNQCWRKESVLASATNQDILDLWSSMIGESLEGKYKKHLSKIFLRAEDSYVPAVEDLKSCMQELKDMNIRLGIATLDDEASVSQMLGKLSLHGIFDFSCGADSGFGVKPEPGMINQFLRDTGVQADQCMMVGDSPRDLQMGRNAGAALCVGVLTGAHTEEMLAPYADVVLKNIGEIKDYLGTNPC